MHLENFIAHSLKIKQLEFQEQIDKVQADRQRLKKFKKEILADVRSADLILSNARAKINQVNAECIGELEKVRLTKFLSLQIDNATLVFDEIDQGREAVQKELQAQLASQEEMIKQLIKQMDAQVSSIINGKRRQPAYTYKKLDLVG